MFCSTSSAPRPTLLSALVIAVVAAFCALPAARAQTYEKELTGGGNGPLIIKNRTGRISVMAAETNSAKSNLRATSTGAPVEPGDIVVSGNEITVKERPY